MIRRTATLTSVLPALALAGVLSQAAWGQTPATPASGAIDEPATGAPTFVDDRAHRALDEMSAYLTALDGFTFRVDATYDAVRTGGQKIQLGMREDVSFRRPNQVRVNVTGDEHGGRIYLDADTFVMYDTLAKTYAMTIVPDDLEAALDHIWEEFGIDAPLSDILFADPYAVLMENVDTGRHIGKHRVNDVICDHLAFTQETFDWQIWIEDGRQRVPRKVVITYKDRPGEPQYTATLSEWKLNPVLSDHIFRFDPPEEANEIEFMHVYEVLTPEQEEQP